MDQNEKHQLFQQRLKEIWGKAGERLKDFTTLTVTTYAIDVGGDEGNPRLIAKTEFFLDGDINSIIPVTERTQIEQDLLSYHKEMVDMAMQNRTELLKALAAIFDIDIRLI